MMDLALSFICTSRLHYWLLNTYAQTALVEYCYIMISKMFYGHWCSGNTTPQHTVSKPIRKIVYKGDTPGASGCQSLERIASWSHTTILVVPGDPQSLASQKSLNWSWTFGILHHVRHPSRTQAGFLATLLPSCSPTQNCSPFLPL